MRNRLKMLFFGLLLVTLNPAIAESTNKPIYVYEGITIQDMAEATQELIRKEEMRDESHKLNKFGEFLYSAKDSLLLSIGDTLANMVRFVSVSTKMLGTGKETNAKILSDLDDVRNNKYFDKALKDSRLGVESDVLSNKVAIMLFCPIGSVLFGGGVLHRIENSTKSVREIETSIYNRLHK